MIIAVTYWLVISEITLKQIQTPIAVYILLSQAVFNINNTLYAHAGVQYRLQCLWDDELLPSSDQGLQFMFDFSICFELLLDDPDSTVFWSPIHAVWVRVILHERALQG